MRKTGDEARLTAYVLGELPESERAELERRLTASEELRQEVEEIRAMADALHQALAAAPRHELSRQQRAAVETKARNAAASLFPLRRILLRPMSLATAASIMIAALIAWRVMTNGESPQDGLTIEVVRNASPTPTVITEVSPTTIEKTATPSPSTAGRGRRDTAIERAVGSESLPTVKTMTPLPAELPASPTPVVPIPMIATTGTITGTVVDPLGAAIPNASVTLTNETTGEAFSVLSDARGIFRMAGLAPGSYAAIEEMPGFRAQRQAQIGLKAGETVDLAQIELPVGSVAEVIAVTAPVPVVRLLAGEIAASKESRMSRKSGRAYVDLLRITPGLEATKTDNSKNVNGTTIVTTTSDLDAIRARSAEFTTEAYDHIRDNPFILVSQDPRSTFSVDVDTASYSNVRRFLNGGSLPPKDAVRIEELLNYFTYDYAQPNGDHPFAVHMEQARCPWKPEHRLVRIGIKGKDLPRGERPPSNLVFLLDVSGSMRDANKLPLVQASLRLLVNELRAQDRVAIVVYAGAEGLALPSTSASAREKILEVIANLGAGGTTHGSAGLRLAYKTAEANFIKGGVNRVILATDGDFNVGVTNQGDLIRLIEENAKSGVFLTALGFGMGNIKDSTLEKLADHGNGNYAYIDGLWEARKVLVDQIGATLVTIAKDVKLQLEFNPAAVKAFRLIGYENRILAHQDFNDDKKDAGEIGAGHAVTALYEIVPAGVKIDVPGIDPLKYQKPKHLSSRAKSNEILTLKLRYKQPDASQSKLMELAIAGRDKAFEKASVDFRFAASVASFGMLLRESPYKGDSSFARVLAWAKASQGKDPGSLRAEFLTLVEKARQLMSSR